MPGAAIHVQGLGELRRALRAVDRGIDKELRSELRGVADDIVPEIQAVIPKRSGRAAASIRSRVSGNRVYILAGGSRKAPYYGWLDFGGKLPAKTPNKKKAMYWSGAYHPVGYARGGERAVIKEGRYVYPTIKRNREQIADAAGDAVENAARKAGFS